MVSDPDRAIATAYGAMRRLISVGRRITYVIDPEGRIAAVFRHEMNVGGHDRDVREFFRERFGGADGESNGR